MKLDFRALVAAAAAAFAYMQWQRRQESALRGSLPDFENPRTDYYAENPQEAPPGQGFLI